MGSRTDIKKINLVALFLSLFFITSATLLFAGDSGRCLRCGMIVAKHPQWEGRMEAKDKVESFCAPRCLLFSHPAGGELGEGVKLMLKDYYSTKFIDATTAWYVSGSDIMGPMGPDMVPFAKKEDAEAFMKEHKGKALYSWKDLTTEKLKEVLPMKHHKKHHGENSPEQHHNEHHN